MDLNPARACVSGICFPQLYVPGVTNAEDDQLDSIHMLDIQSEADTILDIIWMFIPVLDLLIPFWYEFGINDFGIESKALYPDSVKRCCIRDTPD